MLFFWPILGFRGKGISNGVKTERNQLEKLFLEGKQPRELGVHVRGDTGCPRGWGRAHPPRARPLPCGAPVAPLTCFFRLYNSIYPKTSRTQHRSGVPPPEASVATENQSRPVPAPCQRRKPSLEAIFIIPTATMMRRE